jgi:hypothetical protein
MSEELCRHDRLEVVPTEDTHSRIDVKDDGARAGVERGSPSGLAARDAGAHRAAHPVGPPLAGGDYGTRSAPQARTTPERGQTRLHS